jgi:hypothetical protein
LGAGRSTEVEEHIIANTPAAVKKYFTAMMADAEVHASYEAGYGELRICKQRILHFLLRRGIRYDQGGPWTVKHKNWLSRLESCDPRDRKTLDMYLCTMQELEGKCCEAAEEMERIASQDRYREQTKKP